MVLTSSRLLNCWEFKEAQGEDIARCAACSARTMTVASGFLSGENGGRSCMFIADTNCDIEKGLSVPEKIAAICTDCEFYKELKAEDNPKMNYFIFRMHIKRNLLLH